MLPGEESALTGILHRARSRGCTASDRRKGALGPDHFCSPPTNSMGARIPDQRWGRPAHQRRRGHATAHRDATTVLVAYRHGLRPVELVTLRWDAIDFAHGQMHVSRAKNGAPSVHPLSGVELRAMRRLKRDQDPPSPFVFTSERGAPSRRRGGARWWRGWASRPSLASRPTRTSSLGAVVATPTDASKQGGQDRVRTLSLAAGLASAPAVEPPV